MKIRWRISIDQNSLLPEGAQLCRQKALLRAHKKQRPFVVIDRGEQQEPFPNGRHRYICRSLNTLQLEDGWEIVLIVEPPISSRERRRRKQKAEIARGVIPYPIGAAGQQ